MEGIVVRRATEADADSILACLASAFAPYQSSYTPGAYRDTVLTPASLRRRIDSMHVFVGVDGDERVAGTIACAAHGNGHGHLRGMAVLPEYRGRGVAEALLEAAERDLAKQGCAVFTLDTTEPLQRAIRFYEKHGYRRSGRITDFFNMRLHEYVKNL